MDYQVLAPDDAAGFDVLLNTYAAALEANSDGLRCRSSVSAKNDARAALLADTRLLVQRINGYKPLTDADRLDLGIPHRSKAKPTGVPEEKPLIGVDKVDGNRVTMWISRQGAKGGRLPGAIGATVFWAVGDEAPAWRQARIRCRPAHNCSSPARCGCPAWRRDRLRDRHCPPNSPPPPGVRPFDALRSR